jgi:hypothetical protein
MGHTTLRVDTAWISDGREACQSVSVDNRDRSQAGLGLPGDGFAREALDQLKLQAHWLAGRVQRHRRHEGHFVHRAPADIVTRALTSKVGGIHLHEAILPVRCFQVRHGGVDLVGQQPSDWGVHPQIALAGQRRDAGLGLADEMDGQERGRQRQLGELHQRARSQRGLVPARTALEQLADTMTDNVVLHAGATRAATHPANVSTDSPRHTAFRLIFS